MTPKHNDFECLTQRTNKKHIKIYFYLPFCNSVEVIFDKECLKLVNFNLLECYILSNIFDKKPIDSLIVVQPVLKVLFKYIINVIFFEKSSLTDKICNYRNDTPCPFNKQYLLLFNIKPPV